MEINLVRVLCDIVASQVAKGFFYFGSKETMQVAEQSEKERQADIGDPLDAETFQQLYLANRARNDVAGVRHRFLEDVSSNPSADDLRQNPPSMDGPKGRTSEKGPNRMRVFQQKALPVFGRVLLRIIQNAVQIAIVSLICSQGERSIFARICIWLCVLKCGKALCSSVRIRAINCREPSVKSKNRTGLQRVVLTTMKCFTTFFVSIFPGFTIEGLRVEIENDDRPT